MTTTDPVQLPHLLDVQGLAEHLGVEVRHIRRLVHERRVPYIKWGHLVRFDPAEIHDWLERCRHEPRRPA
jgi:excisionase family DNA binding protein